MNLTSAAALAYVNSIIDKLTITEEARESIRRFMPQKMKLVKGFIPRGGAAVVKGLVSGGYRELLRIHTGACWRKLESTDADVPGHYLSLIPDLWIDNVLYISTPVGLAPIEFDAYYISLPIDQTIIDKLVQAGAIEPRDLLVAV